VAFNGRSSCVLITTNASASAYAVTRAYFDGYNDHVWLKPLSNGYYTLGAWFKTANSGVVANISLDASDTAMNRTTVLHTNGWQLLTAPFQFLGATQTLNFGVGLFTYTNATYGCTPPGATVYVDNVFVCMGNLGSNEYVDAGEIYTGNAVTNLMPMYLGEEVFGTNDLTWYKAVRFNTGLAGWSRITTPVYLSGTNIFYTDGASYTNQVTTTPL
jgi:hypothetical protein